jgi:hypothetical protein
MRPDLERIEINVGLIEAIEQDKGVGAGCIEPPRHVGHVAEEGAELYRDGNCDHRLHSAENIDVLLLHCIGAEFRIGGNGVDVAFQSVRSRFLDELGVLRPAPDGGAIEAGNDWH